MAEAPIIEMGLGVSAALMEFLFVKDWGMRIVGGTGGVQTKQSEAEWKDYRGEEKMKMNGCTEEIDQLLESPSATSWLKEALRSALERDPIDAWADAHILEGILKGRMESSLT